MSDNRLPSTARATGIRDSTGGSCTASSCWTTPTLSEIPNLRQRLTAGGRLTGLAACVLRSVEIVTITRACGYDFLLIDTEHSPITIGDAATLATAAQAAGFPALVRIGAPDHPDLARALDVGAEGLVVSHVDTPEAARGIVARCRFPPAGRRSLPGPLARFGFRMPPAPRMMAETEKATLLIPMIESAAALEAAEAIAAVPGLDALMVGTNDLAADLGLAGRLDHPDLAAAFARIARAAAAHGLAFAVIGLPEPLLDPLGFALGARMVVATNDVNLLLDAGTAQAARLRAR